MTEIKIYFNDLALKVQEELWNKLQKDLLENGEVVPQGTLETENEFLSRLWEQTDYYLNTHNFPNRFLI